MRVTGLSLLLPILLACDQASPPDRVATPVSATAAIIDTAAAYRTAIADFIHAMVSTAAPLPDTVYIGRHPEFPKIELPQAIAGRTIRLVDPAEGERVKHRERFAYLNVFASWTPHQVELYVVRFAQGLSHRPNGEDDRSLTYAKQPDGTWKLLRVEHGPH